MVNLPLTGRCQCGEIRYKITTEPYTLYACHCTECQWQSGSAFGMSMKVSINAFHLTQGAPKSWTRSTDSGGQTDCVFCPTCGTRLYHEPSQSPSMVSVKPGTLDDRTWLAPIGHLWIRSKQPWFDVPDGTVNYSGQPESYDQLNEVWEKHRP